MREIGSGPSPKCGLSNLGVQECGGSVFAVGGSGLEPAFAAAWRLDITTPGAAWLPAPALPAAMTWTATACVPTGAGAATLYAIGGFSGQFQPVATVYELSLGVGGVPSATAGWAQATALPGVRAQIAGLGVNSTVFAISGLGAGLATTAADKLVV